MIRLRAVITLAAFACATASAHPAERPSLPLGNWGSIWNGKVDCSKPFLGIEPNRITIRMAEGNGRCQITHVVEKKHTLFAKFKCNWDKSIPPEYLAAGDDDPDEFSLKILSKTSILYNNTPHKFCGPIDSEVR